MAQKSRTYKLLSPLDSQPIGTFKSESEKEVTKKIERQRKAQKDFGRLGLKERIKILKQIRKEFIKQSNALIERTRAETGKPYAEIYGGEIVANIELIDFYVKNAKKVLNPEKVPINPVNYPGKSGYIHHAPLGVVGVLSSWNYPVALAMRAIVPALIAGNAVAFKPSEQASSTGELIGEIFQAHLPEDVLLTYYGQKETNQAIVKFANKINFIGSVATGRSVAALCGENLIPCSTELSGKDAAIVLDDCNFERAVNGVIWGAFTNTGQNCASVERVFVQKGIADKFISAVVEKVKRLRLEDDIGPMKNENQMKMLMRHINEAKNAKGAEILAGGKRIQKTLYFEPTVIKVKDTKPAFMNEETFGPTLPIVVVNDFDEALEKANDSSYGLTMSVWTSDIDHVEGRIADIEAGVITINNCVFTGALTSAPWGGVKETGSGVTNSKYGLLEMTRPQFLLKDKNKAAKEPWWYPYSDDLITLMKTVIGAYSGKVGNYLKVPAILKKVLRIHI